jgi:flagellar basal-body rod protein FlgB
MRFDPAFGIHASALLLRGRRAQVLATNLANADTPNYQARDVDFKQVLQAETDLGVSMRTTHAAHIASNTDDLLNGEQHYRVPMQPSLDGNTVDTQVEQAEFAKNALQYETSLRLLNGRITGLLSALKGE